MRAATSLAVISSQTKKKMNKHIITNFLLAAFLLVSGYSYGQDQKATDDKILSEYFAKNKIKATKTASGLYYVIHKQGIGENAKVGQQVSMLYYGYLLDGKRFDGNMDKNYTPVGEPFSFPLGAHRVISGWDEGVQLLNKGARATLYLPSGLAYGPNGVGPIPPNAILAFDVEVAAIN